MIQQVIVCHTYGVPAEIEEIALFCRRNNLILIEDISECVGVSCMYI
jgi:dTDP-4-amino-4,6-dideoxygalactose transaminase